MDDALDLVGAADDRIHLAFFGDLGEVAAERLERRCLDLLLVAAGLLFLHAGGDGGVAGVALEVRIQLVQDFLPAKVDVDVEILQHARRDALALAQQAQQDVLGADVGVVQRLGFLLGKLEHFLDARGVRDVAGQFLVRAGADLFLDLEAHGLQVEAHFLEDIDGDALAKVDQAQQQVLGAHEAVVEAVGLLSRQRQHLLGARGEVVH